MYYRSGSSCCNLHRMAEKKKSILDRIPLLESGRAFLEQWGIWKWIVGGLTLVGGGLMTLWAWLTSNVPPWGLALIALSTAALILIILNFGYSLFLKHQSQKRLAKFVEIDRDQLADEIETLSQKIAALLGEYRGPMQEAWWKDAASRDPTDIRTGMARIEGKLIEKYSDRHAADVWRLIRRASKVIPLHRSDVWRISHRIGSEHDLNSLFLLLANIADDIRYPIQPLPTSTAD